VVVVVVDDVRRAARMLGFVARALVVVGTPGRNDLASHCSFGSLQADRHQGDNTNKNPECARPTYFPHETVSYRETSKPFKKSQTASLPWSLSCKRRASPLKTREIRHFPQSSRCKSI